MLLKYIIYLKTEAFNATSHQQVIYAMLKYIDKCRDTLCLCDDEISNIIKSNYGRTFHKLCIINIISSLHKEKFKTV